MCVLEYDGNRDILLFKLWEHTYVQRKTHLLQLGLCDKSYPKRFWTTRKVPYLVTGPVLWLSYLYLNMPNGGRFSLNVSELNDQKG